MAQFSIYQRTKDGNPETRLESVGSRLAARPEIFFSKYLSLAFEGGFDHTHSRGFCTNGWLRKFTISRRKSGAGRKFFQPARTGAPFRDLRPNWSDGLRGLCRRSAISKKKQMA